MLPSSQRERRVSRLNRTGKNTTGWARRLTALLVTACLVMAMALPVYAEVDPLPGAPDEVELLEDGQGTASGEDTVPPEQNAATPVPDAATPEPEQSAEPEQPAPTETLEPTAEPTPTPEPAATATATPVPTVTPTATPEPTEQPQKMYAARSVDNVQAVSEPEATDGFTVYFVVPDTMPNDKNQDVTVLNSDEIRFNVNTDANTNGNCWQSHTMEPTGWETNGHKIYAVKNCKDIRGENFYEIQFQLYRDDKWTAQITLKQPEPKPISSYNNKMYVPTADGKSGEWTNDSILTSHTYYANKPIKFENRSTADLTNVKANFYIPDESGNLTLVNGDSTAQDVPQGEFVGFTIPDVECSYVQFTWDEGGKSKYYNFYNEPVSGNDIESFMYSETRNCFIYTGADNVRWGRENSFRIYYDATFSKLPTTGREDTGGDYSIPKAKKETIYFRIKGGDNGNTESGTLVKDGTNENLYYVDIPQEYSSNSSIIFSGVEIGDDNATKGNGVSTEWLPIPTDDKNCFYADTNDDAVYKDTTTRGGYWAPKGTLRDAETWKNTDTTDTTKTKVVDIASVPFTEEANTKYVTSTLYDYYTDYELNGKNRDNYGEYRDASHRTWVPFREFDQALSDYYDKAGAQYPIYTGHFQPASPAEFSQIASTLNLFGYDKFKRFMAINNSQYNEDPQNNDNNHTYYAYQGLVADTTSTSKATGEPLLKGTEIVEPHFNKDFLLGENSKKAKLGEVYENVKFPFTKVKNLFGNETNVDYWCFDSKDTTLYLKQDSGQNSDSKYFLQSADNRESSRNVSASSNPKDPYGYFPFNETANPGVFSTYNYGFGTKLQMDFTLTDDGKVEKDNADGTKGKTSIKFFFSGDDDVWVFIDGKLALDVGGAHGEVSGLLEFGEVDTKEGKKNSVTAYVSRVKKGGTAKNNDIDEKGGSPVKTVKYNGENIDFYAKNTNLEPLDKGQKHTLTMYYMERGMWESNMAVAFNFPDNNELQVQKIVDTTDVNDWFKSCFDTPDLFAFNIQNQATHYQNPKHDATIGSDVKPIELNTSDYASCKPATENSTGNIFKLTTELGDAEALHWYAKYQDTNPPSRCRSERYGILTLNHAIDISQMRYLTFDIYAKSESGQGELSLGNLYLELLDNNGKQKGCLDKTCLNGTTYGTVTLANDKWITVKLDLYKLNAVEGFDQKQVTTIRVGDNYPRHIYFKNFVFSAQAKVTTKTGFTTKQEDIPVYGSIDARGLTNAAGAQFTTTKNNDTQVVDENGQFMLQNGETVTFSDQFRRGSYISLKETLSPNLYDTTWTVFENDEAVQSYGSGNTVKGDTKNLNGQAATESQPGPDDGRTEVYNPTPDIANDGYTKDKKPDANTIVFRSYKDPDENASSLTKLKVQFVNKVKTGKLVIKKAAASGEDSYIKGEYTFNVTFTNVGDEGLEQETIKKQVTIDMNSSSQYEISGIPIGTRFRIEEVKTSDGSHLQGVSVTGGDDTQVVYNTYVQGSISGTDVTATFTNTMHELINIDFTKTWENANGDPLEDGLPKEIYIQLQRRKTKNDPWQPVGYPEANSPKYVKVTPNSNGWDCAFAFTNLDKFDVADQNHTNYQYRIVEGTVDDEGNFAEVKPNETITINGNTYVVTAEAEATANSETNSAGSSTDNTATANSETNSETGATTTPATVPPDGTITGGSGKIVLTNTLQNPKFALDIIKKDAEPNNAGEEVFLKDVEFKLEKLKQAKTGGTQWEVDTSYTFNNNDNLHYLTGTTGTDGEIKNNPFKDLEPGRYRLTETKAHEGYNLLSKSIDIEFTQDGKYKIDDGPAQKATGDAASGYTVTFTVLNRKTPELPHTGADAPSLWLLIGMPLAVAGLLIFTFRYNRKGGRRH